MIDATAGLPMNCSSVICASPVEGLNACNSPGFTCRTVRKSEVRTGDGKRGVGFEACAYTYLSRMASLAPVTFLVAFGAFLIWGWLIILYVLAFLNAGVNRDAP